jgi:hypothetical protein
VPVSALDPDTQLLFERIYEHRQDTGEWPNLELLQRQLAKERKSVSVRALVMNAASYAGFRGNDDVGLTLQGLAAAVPAARPLLEAYLRVLHAIIERYSDTTQPARFTRSDLSACGIGGQLKEELSELIRDDGFALGSGGGENGSWSYEISDRVMSAVDAGTVDKLVAIRTGAPAPAGSEGDADRPAPLSGVQGEPTVDADRPIRGEREDLLDRQPLAAIIARQASGQLGDGFVMGITGPWGSGKTSLLNLMGAAIEGADAGYIVRFDPWLFSSSEELVLRFLRELQAQLGGERHLANAAARIGEYAEILAPVSALAGAPSPARSASSLA